MVTLVIIEANEITRTGLKGVLQSSEEIELLREYGSTTEAMSASDSLAPEVVLLGVGATGEEDSQPFREVRGLWPEAKILALSGHNSDDVLFQAIESGVSGCVARSADGAELIRCVRVVSDGGLCFENDSLQRLISRISESEPGGRSGELDRLTERETAVLALMSQGYRNGDIGRTLNISASTVRNCIAQLRSKLKADSRAELIAAAVRHGLDLSGECSRD